MTTGPSGGRGICVPLQLALTAAVAAGVTAAVAGVRVVRPRTRELAAALADVERLRHRMAATEDARVRLVGEFAHEMRTPLTVLDGYLVGMIDGVLPRGEEELAQLRDEVRRLRRLTGDLSTLSRAEEGRLELHEGRHDLGEVVATAAERMRPLADAAGLVLTVHPSAPIPVTVDVDRVGQVLTNLLSNAIHATPAGGRIEVSVGSGDRPPWPDATAAAQERRWTWFTVVDTGAGLRPEHREAVFERFYRVPGAEGVASAEAGSGIGLTIARSIVRAHGGDLRADSGGPGRGATFTAAWPACRADGAPPPRGSHSSRLRG